MDDRGQLLRLLAEVLEYPRTDAAARARACEQMLRSQRPAAAAALAVFASFAEAEPTARLEELYTATFDLNPQCYPYAGYQLFGEDPKRSELMIRLHQGFRAAGFEVGNELPDYVPALLRFLSVTGDSEAGAELRDLVLVPALEKMVRTLEEKENPYAGAVAAALLVMSDEG